MSKVVRIRIPNEEIWNNFIKYIEKKHGKVWGMIGFEVEKALKFYMEKEDTDTHTQTGGFSKQTNIKNIVHTLEPLVNTRNTTDGGQQTIQYGEYENLPAEDISRLNILVGELKKYRKAHGPKIKDGRLNEIIMKYRWSIPKYKQLLMKRFIIDIDTKNPDYYIILI
jgi:hypothetical protein